MMLAQPCHPELLWLPASKRHGSLQRHLDRSNRWPNQRPLRQRGGLHSMRAYDEWREFLPRIVEEIPRRIPRPDQLRTVDIDQEALLRLIFPEGSSDFLQLSWVFLIFAAVFAAVVFELSLLAVKIFSTEQPSVTSSIDDNPSLTSGKEPPPPLEQEIAKFDPTIITSPRRERLEEEKAALKPYIRAERYRGLSWLAAITIFAIWCTGVLNKENPLAP